MLQKFEAKKAESFEGKTVHVAMFDDRGTILIHEELPAGPSSWLRCSMIESQCQIDTDGGNARMFYKGATWPPEGHEEEDGKVTPLQAEE